MVPRTSGTSPPLPGGGGIPAETVAAASAAANTLDVFAASNAGRTPYWWHWDGTAWLPAQPLPGNPNLFAERIAAVSTLPGRLDVFAAGAGNSLWHWWHQGAWPGTWQVETLGGSLPPEGVSVVSVGVNRMDVFAAARGGIGNPLQHWWWAVGPDSHLPRMCLGISPRQPSARSQREPIGGTFSDFPAMASLAFSGRSGRRMLRRD
jgi:hypothetical protein